MGYHQEVADDRLSYRAIGCALEVHRTLGCDFAEEVYRDALCIELEAENLFVEREKKVTIRFRDKVIGYRYLDLLVEGELVLELKSVTRLSEDHFRQLGTNVAQAQLQRGLLLNFGAPKLGIRRYVR